MQNIRSFLESAIETYYSCRHILLLLCGYISLCIPMLDIGSLTGRRRYAINKALHKMLYAVGIVLAGNCLYLLGIQITIEYRYFNTLFFITACLFLILCFLVQCIVFRNKMAPVLQVLKYFQFLLFLQLLLLAMTDHLELIEAIAGVLTAGSVEIMLLVLEQWQKEQQKAQNSDHTKESDYPNIDLFPTRRRQLECFIPVLKQQKDEPYALMISAEWGMGKSSFVKALALDSRMSGDHFIWIMAGSEKSVSEIMLEISEQIIKILRENNIFIEREHSIEKYFLAFSGLFEETSLGAWGRLAHTLGIRLEKDARSKQYLNSKLTELHSTIYLIIDDLDRCEPEYRSKMFKVIRESTDLTNCKTIFLADGALFHTDRSDASAGDHPFDYMEKYISYTLYLYPVRYDEIADFHLPELFSQTVVAKYSRFILNDRTSATIQELVRMFPYHVLRNLNEKIENGKHSSEDAAKAISQIERNLTNPRKVKNYFKDIKLNLGKLSSVIPWLSMEYWYEDWINAILTVSFVKHILPEKYSRIQSCMSIYAFFQQNSDDIIHTIMKVSPCKSTSPNKRAEMLNYIMFRLDIMGLSEREEIKHKYCGELQSNNIHLAHVRYYLEIADSPQDYQAIVKAYANAPHKTVQEKSIFIEAMMDRLSAPSSPLKADTEISLSISRDLMEALTAERLTEHQKQLCITAGTAVMENVIRNTRNSFKYPLYLFFNNKLVDTVWEKWEKYDISTAADLLVVLHEIDTEDMFFTHNNPEDNIQKAISYYNSMELELLRRNTFNTYNIRDIFSSIESVFAKVTHALLLYDFWEKTIQSLRQETDMLTPYMKYFDIQGNLPLKDSIFENTDNLSEALALLAQSLKELDLFVIPKLSKAFLQTMHRLVEMYENNPTWFRNGATGMSTLQNQAVQLAKEMRDFSIFPVIADPDTSHKIDILVYKFSNFS